METQGPQMDWLYILSLMGASGAFGGALSVLQLYDVRKLIEPNESILFSRNRFVAALILGVISGVGGAIAMLFVISATAKLDTTATTANKLLLFSLGMISGFLGYRALGGVATRVERQISEIEAKTDRRIDETKDHLKEITEKRLNEAQSNLKHIAEYYDALNMGLAAAIDIQALLSDDLEAISRLKNVRQQMPDNREISIVLARIYAKRSDYSEAIKILTELIQALKDSGRVKDIADALFNRACYYNLMADNIASDESKALELKDRIFEYKEKAYVDLKESIRLSPDNKDDAMIDPDLQSLRTEERVKQLIVS